jgi:hypothetical protein
MKRAGIILLSLLASCDDSVCTGSANCLPPRPPGLRYAVELAPTNNMALVREQFPDLVTDADGHAALTFDAPAIVSGRVYVGTADMPSIAAQISAVPAGDPPIPGHPLLFGTHSTAAVNLGATSFRLALPPGSYNLLVTPDPPDATSLPILPPMIVPVNVSADRMLDIALPGPNDLFHVTGRIFDSTLQGVANMSVDVEQDGRVVSTTGITDGGGGFDIVMPRAAGMYTLHAKPAMGSTTVAPTLEQSLALDGTAGSAQPILRLPAYTTPASYHFIVHARTAAGLQTPVPGTQIAFSATLPPDPDATPATFSANATTDILGGADVTLIPGVQYTVTVQTSPSSEYASVVLEHYSLDSQLPDIELGQKTEVTGTLVGADGKAVAGAAIHAVGISAAASQNTTNTSPTGAGTAQTDAMGRFRVLLDPGTYDLEAQPQDGSPYPRWALQGLVVTTTAPDPVTFQLPTASRIEGRVSGPDGKPQEADVSVYLVDKFGGQAQLEGRLRGQAHAAPDGSFSLVLANPQLPTH